MNVSIGTRYRTEFVGNLQYGTGVYYQGSYYIKVAKHSTGQGIKLSIPSGHSLLVNMKSGSLRAVSGSVPVEVLVGNNPDGRLNVTISPNPHMYCKE